MAIHAPLSVASEDFKYGEYDGHHTYFEGEEEKGLLSWLFLPAVAAGMFFNAPGEYLFIGGGVFTIIFCIIEMDKPDKPHHFEPQIYNMERGARAKLINDYNTMSIWGFNEKYGDLWDFTIKKDDITKR
ncbi:Photosynthetic NDH subunit of subcomplex B 5 [Hibiscus syriacus]|uniref:Photosynthetic NDH subunit of subcomplex B 5 n=1 Tax=Hibiscus syriacus TaxID=106335 RepID=A0A6A2X6B2_HIBSY|nr:Photosynthetic NDH subunit of subcomplex B 5 [Hibiscus syriacus]